MDEQQIMGRCTYPFVEVTDSLKQTALCMCIVHVFRTIFYQHTMSLPTGSTERADYGSY